MTMPTQPVPESRAWRRPVTPAALLAVICLLATSSASRAQEAFLELLRADVRAGKVELLTATMELSDDEAAVFWPIYRDYERELAEVADERIRLAKDYFESYAVMTEQRAGDLAQQWLRLQESRLKLRKKYYKKVDKALSAIVAARFLQVEHQIELLIDLQVAADVPLIAGME